MIVWQKKETAIQKSTVLHHVSINKEQGIISLYSAPYYIEYNIREFLNKKTDYCSKTNCSKLVSHSAKNARKLGNGYLFEGFTSDMRFMVADNSIKVICKDYPPMLPEEKKEDVAAVHTYNSDMLVSPNKSRWVQTSYIGGILEIFEYDGGKIKNIGTNPIYKPVYMGEKQDVSWEDKTIIGFDDMVVTDKYIYTLLNGAMGKQLKSNPPVNPFTNKITVFDWNGNIKKIINTDCMLLAIDVDEREDVCYGISIDLKNGYELRRIPLSMSK